MLDAIPNVFHLTGNTISEAKRSGLNFTKVSIYCSLNTDGLHQVDFHRHSLPRTHSQNIKKIVQSNYISRRSVQNALLEILLQSRVHWIGSFGGVVFSILIGCTMFAVKTSCHWSVSLMVDNACSLSIHSSLASLSYPHKPAAFPTTLSYRRKVVEMWCDDMLRCTLRALII